MDNNFEIKQGYSGIFIKKGKTSFSIEKKPDRDIWFKSSNNIELLIRFNSINQEEWRSYVIFERLMKLIIGKYILNDDWKNEYNSLPKDFVDLKNKTIILHSDSGNNNILKLQFNENEITVSITRDNNISNRNSNDDIRVRIRTNGSDYGDYYQEFECLFNELSSFAYQVNSMKKTAETQPTIQKRLSIFNKFKK